MKKYRTESFGTTKEGLPVTKYILTNECGAELSVLDYGCRIQKLLVPDRDGNLRNVAAGYTDLALYEAGSSHGALIGRFANRIKNARFVLDGKEVQLVVNDHENYIHGNYAYKVWNTEAEDGKLTFTYDSPDGEFGFPGNVRVKAVYEFTEQNEVVLTYEAVTDAPTVVNITNHSYFNLDGLPEDCSTAGAGNVIDEHLMWIDADQYLEADDINMVTGKEIPVEGTDFDFRSSRPITGKKYDHNFCINGYDGTLRKAAEVVSEKTGITMAVCTTQPGVQVYSGQKVCLAMETQHYPDGPNHPEWPDTTLRPGETYIEKTVYSFGILEK